MKLSIYSLKNILFQGSALLLNCQTVAGEITILNNHETLITVLAAGVIRIVAASPEGRASLAPKGRDENLKEYFFPIKSGFLEVRSDNEVRCIVEQ
jgi:F0F1-type ATP synthase epsilon subunit